MATKSHRIEYSYFDKESCKTLTSNIDIEADINTNEINPEFIKDKIRERWKRKAYYSGDKDSIELISIE